MYGGRVAEAGTSRQVLTAPRHPYTAALVATSAAVALDSDRTRAVLPAIAGQVPPAGAFGAGCPFRGRCDRATAQCETVPPLALVGDHHAACFHPVPVPSARGGGMSGGLAKEGVQ
jgi:peptide/nickel transport system ATP-binding protein